MSDIVWSIHLETDSLETLELRMRAYAVSLFEAQGIVLNMNIERGLPGCALPDIARKDVYLIFKEAVNNVSKHAQARQVWVRLARGEDGLQLTVRDNGAGYNTNDQRTDRSGNGIGNMQARADAISASLSITSNPGVGTEICLRLPRSLERI